MAEITKEQCAVLGAFPNAGANAWSNLLTESDRETYREVHDTLLAIGEKIVGELGDRFRLVPTSGFTKSSGVRNNRPKDLWIAIANSGSEAFLGMPQIYMIASGRGVELGFAAAIHRSDFSNADIKKRLAAVIPTLFSLLPTGETTVIKELARNLQQLPGWSFRRKARLTPGADFNDLQDFLSDLRSNEGRKRGSGSICKVFSPDELTASVNLENEFRLAASLFSPLLHAAKQTYTSGESITAISDALAQLDPTQTLESVSQFMPSNLQDARKRVLVNIVRRMGQGSFRADVLSAYNGVCAVTGAATPEVLEAAHIFPYKGPETNHVTNGILLRGDIHTLFDLGLLRISPRFQIELHPSINDPAYSIFAGSHVRLPDDEGLRPSLAAIEWKYRQPLLLDLSWGEI